MKYTITVQDQTFDVQINSVSGDKAQVTVNQTPYTVTIKNRAGGAPVAAPKALPAAAPAAPAAPKPEMAPVSAAPKAAARPAGAGEEVITAPIPGVILSVNVQVGDSVTSGQTLAVMEAMKMENNLTCHMAGTVKEVFASKGAELGTGDVVMIIG